MSLAVVGCALLAPAAADPHPGPTGPPAASRPAIPSPSWTPLPVPGGVNLGLPSCSPDDVKCFKEAEEGLAEGSKTNPVKDIVTSVGTAAVFGPLRDGVNGMCADLFTGMFTWWWHDTTSVNIRRSGALYMWGVCLFLGEVLATVLFIGQAIKTMIARKGTPLIEGLRGLAVAAVMSLAGIAAMQMLLYGGDQATNWILDTGREGIKDRAFGALIGTLNTIGAGNAVAGIFWGLVIFLVGLIQMVVWWLRQAAIPLLAVLLPVVAAGQVGGRATSQWASRYWAAFGAIAAYKPLVAVIYAVGFSEIGKSRTLADLIRGLTTLVLAVIAMPVLLRVFAPIVQVAGGSGGGGVLGMVPLLAYTASSMGRGSEGSGNDTSGSGTTAAEHASRMDQGQPPPRPEAPQTAPPGGTTQTAQTAQAAQTAAGTAGTGEPISTVLIEGAKQGKAKADAAAGHVSDAGSGAGSAAPPPAAAGGGSAEPEVTMRSPEAPPVDLPEDRA